MNCKSIIINSLLVTISISTLSGCITTKKEFGPRYQQAKAAPVLKYKSHTLAESKRYYIPPIETGNNRPEVIDDPLPPDYEN